MKQKIKQLSCFLLACQLFVITAWAKPTWPADTGIQADAGIVIDAESGAVLFGQNIHDPYPPASITKILTALIVLEHSRLEDTVPFSETAMYSVESDSGNKLSLVAGDTMTVEDCLYSLLLISVNQAANALAEHVAGSIPAFVDMMNEKLVELGCTESHFDNPSGLNGDTQYVSAYDMALIAQAAYKNETLLKINAQRTHTIAPTTNNPEGVSFRTEHRLLYTDDSSSPFYLPAAKAGKTGYLLKAGNTLVTYAESDGRKLISVILKGQQGQTRQYFLDGKELLVFGFDRFMNLPIAGNETRYVTGDETVKTARGDFKPTDLLIEPGRVITLPKNASFADADLALNALPDIHPDRAVALLTYTYDDRVIGTAYLTAKDGVILADEPVISPEGEDGTSKPAASTDADGKQSGRILTTALIAIFIVLLIAAVGGGIAWIIYSRKKEAQALARRRERRRQRLQQSGDADEFEKLLAEMKKNRDK